jgi:lambda family phage portal protein
MVMVNYDRGTDTFVPQAEALPVLSVDSLPQFNIFDGDKFPGGFGETKEFFVDYWTLRARSAQLFTENLYARGFVRRLITNEINTGLCPEASPDSLVLNTTDEKLADWSDEVEQRFHLWARDPLSCDYLERHNYAAIQRAARLEALVSGDVLVVLRQGKRSRLPNVQLVDGARVRTPYGVRGAENKDILHGVERDTRGRHVAFWILQDDGGFKRVPAVGSRSGRRVAWLEYGTDRRFGTVRGQPFFALMMQSLKEIDRYRDAVQRKAVVNSFLAMFIKKTQNLPASRGIGQGATTNITAQATDSDGKTRDYKISKHLPGMIMETLQTGEEPVGFQSQGVDLNFGPFEAAIVHTMAWASEVPPEILQLAFSNNYSASQAAINEFKIYLNKFRSEFGQSFCQPAYEDWLISMVLLGKIAAPGLLDAWRNSIRRDEFSAWVDCDWSGAIKPSTDLLKQAKGYQMLVAQGWITNARASRELTGMKFRRIVKRLERENQELVEAKRPLAEFGQEFAAVDTGASASAPIIEEDVEGIALQVVEEQKESGELTESA